MIELAFFLATAPFDASGYVSISGIGSADFVSECAKDRGMQMDICTTYILGVSDALQVNKLTCRDPSDIATMQTLAIVRKYISSHPEEWNKHPYYLVQKPLMAAFPCSKE